MDNYVEKYQAKHGGITLHTWTDVQGEKKDNFYITGYLVPQWPSGSWVVLRTKHLADIAVFPFSLLDLMPKGLHCRW